MEEKHTKNITHYYFISPHFDDAVLSAGDLLAYLSKDSKVTVINVFTKSKDLNTQSAKAFLKKCGYKNSIELFNDRDKEDRAIFDKLKVERQNLGFVDALWRTLPDNPIRKLLGHFIPEAVVLYPTYRYHAGKGKVSKNDEGLILEISNKLKKLIRSENSYVFCPMAVGNHVDHHIVKRACDKAFTKLIYWTDYPYILKEKSKHLRANGFKKGFTFKKNHAIKRELIRMYKTQIEALFPDGEIPLSEEKYYVTHEFRESLWKNFK